MENVSVATSGQISASHQAAIAPLSGGTQHLATFISPDEWGQGKRREMQDEKCH